MSDREKRLATFYDDDGGASLSIFTENEGKPSGLPRKLKDALPVASARSKNKALSDNVGVALEELEEQSLLKSDAGVQAANALQQQRKRTIVQPLPPPIPKLADYTEYEITPQDEHDDKFFERMNNLSQLEQINDLAVKIHTQTEQLAYVSSMHSATAGLWFKASQQHLIQHGIGSWERVPMCSRAYLAPFWREVDPSCKLERPCSRINCESERLAGFRLRELQYPEEWARIKSDPSKALPTIVNWCVMCHLVVTNELYLVALNKLGEKYQVDGVPSQAIEGQLFRIHHFGVFIDIEGEYKLSQTLVGDKNVVGIFAAFPTYNVKNYTQIRGPKGLRGWQESDTLVFRQARAMSDRIESSPTTLGGQANSSTQSALTGRSLVSNQTCLVGKTNLVAKGFWSPNYFSRLN